MTTTWEAHLAATDCALLAQRNTLHLEASMCRHYLANADAPRNSEASTKAYRGHRNRRQAGYHAQRLSEMRQRAEAAEAKLEKLPLLYEYCFLILGQSLKTCHKSLLF